MTRQKGHQPTELNENDRKVLEKYAGFYTNFIESNTAKTENTDFRFNISKEP